MNLWIFNHYAHPPDLPGGTRHFDLGRELVKRGHKVTIFASSFHHYLHKEVRLKPGEQWKLEDIEGLRFVWIRTPPYQRNDNRRVQSMLVYALRAWRLGQKLGPVLGRPDVVIGSSPHPFASLAAYWVARHHQTPFVMEVRDLWPQTLIDMGALGAQHPLTKVLQALERFLYRRAEWIITLGPKMKEYITARGISPDKVTWIPNGVDLSRFEDLKTAPRTGEGFKVMYLGAHGQANALDTLIYAAKAVQDRGFREIRFVLVGDGPEKPNLVKLAERLKLKNIDFRDPVPKDKIFTVFQEASAFIFKLERAEVFKYGISSNKLFDYMAMARPIIFSVQSSNNPVKEANSGLTVPPRDPQALADAIIALYMMPEEEREAMGRRGRGYVEKFHSITILTTRLEKVLAKVNRSAVAVSD